MLNRPSLYAAIERMVGDSRGGSVSALLIVRAARYRELASLFGYEVMERVDDAMQQLIRHSLRPADAVHPIGDGAFAVLLPDLRAPNLAVLAAMRLSTAFDTPLDVEGRQILVSICVGIAIAPDHATAPDELCRHAESACLEAPRRFERFLVHEPDADAEALSGAELHAAIAENRLSLALQPVLDLRIDSIVGVEALARWQQSGRIVAPSRFVALAEQTGMIGALTHWSLNASLRHAAAIRAAGGDLFMALNLSPRMLRQSDFVEQVAGALEIWNVPGTSVVLELTETAIMEDPTHSSRVLARLRERGLRIAIDDFGTGYSSFSYLRRLPATELKIDISFVAALHDDARMVKVVRSMIGLAHHLDMVVIAEGIEDAATFELLRDMGCDMAQGYHVGMPVAAEAFVAQMPRHPLPRTAS